MIALNSRMINENYTVPHYFLKCLPSDELKISPPQTVKKVSA